MHLRYILGDTETTGPTPSDKVCELAWVELNEELEVIDKQYSLIDPQIRISAGASGIHGITNQDVAEAPTIEEFFGEVLTSPLDGPVMLIAHNVQFDKRYLAPFIPNLAGELCTLRLARRFWPDAENHKLSTLMYHLALTRGESHRADGDVETCLDLLRKIVEKSGKSLPELAAESMEPLFVKVMPFGKHKGTLLKDLPRSYIDWALKLDNLDRDMRYSLELVKTGSA
jgi:exodeoxyribonuclease X